MKYWFMEGVVTGGWYASKCGCRPYKVNPTDHNEKPTPRCEKKCIKEYSRTYAEDKHHGNLELERVV